MKLLLTKREVCERLSLSRATVDRLRSRGLFPQARRVGKMLRWRVADVEEWAARRKAA